MCGEQERGLLAEVAPAMEQMAAFGCAVGGGDWLVLGMLGIQLSILACPSNFNACASISLHVVQYEVVPFKLLLNKFHIYNAGSRSR